ncbi:MAG TPA: CYTH and CHAD domain-containing protein [Ilumatobacteraceae bacterium]|nr:CYTH and CHAD domain-containing protein [Ilumatobacteraceae bacterium]HRB04550.1 CYTH and CHAD domain-containing protein [Ilumatobacteraceae bacterium]
MAQPQVYQEIERKLEVPNRFRLPTLSAVSDGIGKVIVQPTLHLRADYYDTADLRLARNRITLRRRTGGGDDGWHLKLPHADEATRDEVRLPLDSAGHPPTELVHLALGMTRGAVLTPVATLRTERRPSLVYDPHGVALAEVTDDRVSVTIDGKVTSRFRELEVEAAPGRTADDLDDIITTLVAAGARESTFASKAVRALGSRASEPPDIPLPRRAGPHDAAGDALHGFLAGQVAAFIAHDLGVRRGLPDSVHQLRVAARRLRSALKVFGSLLDPDWATELRAELAWIAGEMGAARDNEVLKGTLLAGLAQVDTKGTKQAAAVVRRELARDEHDAAQDVSATLQSTRYLALLDALVDAARAPRFTAAATEAAGKALPPLMRATWRQLARAVRALRRNGPDDDWHRARIRAKQARYAADALAPVFGRPARRLAKQLEQVTELLGRHQDAAVAAEAAMTLAGCKGVGDHGRRALGLLHDAQRAEVRSIRKEFTSIWPSVAKPRRRRWLRPGD